MTETKTAPFQKTIRIEGLGSVSSEGELNVEKLIKRLLQSKYITG